MHTFNGRVMVLFLAFLIVFPSFAQEDPDPNRFLETLQLFQSWDAKNAIPNEPVLFVGSSSIRMWETAESFPALPVVNRGFGGAHISDMLYFKQDILLKYKAPEVVVMYCGDNDIAGGKSPQRVVKDFITWWNIVNEAFPETRLVYIPIKPCPARWHLWEQANEVNQTIADLCDTNPLLFYADTASPMLETGSPPADELFIEDMLHLNAKGYAMWTEVVRSTLTEALK